MEEEEKERQLAAAEAEAERLRLEEEEAENQRQAAAAAAAAEAEANQAAAAISTDHLAFWLYDVGAVMVFPEVDGSAFRTVKLEFTGEELKQDYEWYSTPLDGNRIHQVLDEEVETRMLKIDAGAENYEIEALADSNQARHYPANIFIAQKNIVLLIGGYIDEVFDTVSVFNVEEGSWTMMPQTLTTGRALCSACLVGNSLFVVAGTTGNGVTNTIERLPIAGLEDASLPWEQITPPEGLTPRREPLSLSTGVNQNQILILGGYDKEKQFKDAWCLNTETNEFSQNEDCERYIWNYYNSACFVNNGTAFAVALTTVEEEELAVCIKYQQGDSTPQILETFEADF